MAGVFGVLQGLALIAKGTFYVQPENYWINTSASTWGWWLLLVGLVVLAAGFVFIPVQPFWAITLILVDLWVMHALFVHRREVV